MEKTCNVWISRCVGEQYGWWRFVGRSLDIRVP